MASGSNSFSSTLIGERFLPVQRLHGAFTGHDVLQNQDVCSFQPQMGHLRCAWWMAAARPPPSTSLSLMKLSSRFKRVSSTGSGMVPWGTPTHLGRAAGDACIPHMHCSAISANTHCNVTCGKPLRNLVVYKVRMQCRDAQLARLVDDGGDMRDRNHQTLSLFSLSEEASHHKMHIML